MNGKYSSKVAFLNSPFKVFRNIPYLNNVILYQFFPAKEALNILNAVF